MKVLHLSTSDLNGGAARAAYRLHQGLQDIKVSSQMLIQKKLSDDVNIISQNQNLEKVFAKLRTSVDKLPLLIYRSSEYEIYSLQWLFNQKVTKIVQHDDVDIINLHWICDGFLSIENLVKFQQPIVWTLHDMWAFTGGCHYSQQCDRYTDSCGACPQLSSSNNHDLSHWVWQRKAKVFKDTNLTVVTPSMWLAKCASSSSLFKNLRIEVISNGIDTTKYQPMNRQIARQMLGIPTDKYLVLFSAIDATSNSRKGFHLLQQALQSLSQTEWKERFSLAIVGALKPAHPPDLGFDTYYLGKLNDDMTLAQSYAAADVFIAPSIQDNLPNTVMEALACGTPSVAFHIGGMPDLIEHQQNGYLVQPYKTEDLAQGICWVLENKERYQKLCDRAREKVEQEFTLKLQARRYSSLFTELLSSQSSKLEKLTLGK